MVEGVVYALASTRINNKENYLFLTWQRGEEEIKVLKSEPTTVVEEPPPKNVIVQDDALADIFERNSLDREG